MKNNIFINKNILCDKSISNEAIGVYLSINSFVSDKVSEYFIHLDQIEYVLYKRKATYVEKDCIKKGFFDLVDVGFIEIKESYNKRSFVCNINTINEFNFDKEFYVKISVNEIRKIMNITSYGNKFSLLRYFVTAVGSFAISGDEKYKFKIGNMPQSYLADAANTTPQTVISYNKILLDNELLYVARNKVFMERDNNGHGMLVSRMPNIYSRYKDKQLCDEFAKDYHIQREATNYKNSVDESRKYVQMYNAMLKGKEYPQEVVNDIYLYVKKWNVDKKRRFDDEIANGHHPHEPKYKDLTIFDKYNLTN